MKEESQSCLSCCSCVFIAFTGEYTCELNCSEWPNVCKLFKKCYGKVKGE